MSIFNKGTLNPSTGNGPAPVAPSTGDPIYGCDVYHFDDVTSWSEMLSGGIAFVYIKASQGMSADPKFKQYYAGAKAAGLIVGLYHFYASGDQTQQAKFFASLCNSVGYTKEDLPPCFDFEKASGDFSSADATNALTFLNALQAASGRLPMLYMSDSTPSSLGTPSWMKFYPWWIARYGHAPVSPYTILQYSESASIPGLGNSGDKNIFNGSLLDLKSFISKT